MVISDNRITTVKFRIIGNNVQLLRVDEEIDAPLCADDKQQLFEQISNIIENDTIDAVIFEDYDKGALSPSLIEQVVIVAKNKNIPVTVDPKKRNFNQYNGVTLFKPNLKELKEGTKSNINFKDNDALTTLVSQYLQEHDIQMALITLSERGVLVVYQDENRYKHLIIPAHFRNIVDVSGAGDTVISAATLALTLGISPEKMAAISNLAGGLVCEEVGVVPVNKTKLMNEIARLNLI